ncbi:glycosyltransferase family 4 protein [Ferruginibacter profundus]
MEARFKILHVLYSGLGGHGNVFFSLVNADKQREFVHEALFNGVEEMREEYKERCRHNNIRFDFVKKKPGLDLRFYKNLVATIKKAEPDIVFLHGSTQVLWAKLALLPGKKKCRLIVRETQANSLKTKQDWFWLSAALLLADKIVFLSAAYDLEIKKKLSLLYSAKKATVIPNGIDLSEYQPKQKEHSSQLVIGMQSRIVKIKDHVTLLHAFAGLLKDVPASDKKIFLKIAGDGECRQSLEQLAGQLGISAAVEFTGMLTEQQLIQFLTGLDIYVHASFGETMSTAIMQAMACGLPIIASDVPGINNMISNKVTGLLVPVQDVQQMTAALKLYLQNEKYRAGLAENAYKFAERHYSNQKMFAAYKAVFEIR